MKNKKEAKPSFFTIRDEGLKDLLDKWRKKYRRPNRSDAARVILEDRFAVDGIK